MSLRIRRGTNSERLTKTFDQGELAWTTDTEKLYVGDGVTLGGKNVLQSSAGVGFVFNSTTQALEFTVPALNLTTSLVPDSVTTNHLTTGSSGTTFKVVSTAGIQPGMLIVASSFLSGQTVTVVVDSQTLTISSAPDAPVVNNTAIIFRSPNLYFTNSRAGQAVYDAFGRGSNSGITFAYNAGTNAISATVATGNLLPSQTGNSGKYLTTDGIGGLTWTNPISGNMLLPSEAGQQGKYLKVDNNSLPAWADIVLDRLTVNAYSTVLDSFGNLTTPGDIKIPAGKDIKRDNGTGTYVSITGGLGAVSQDTSPSLGGNLSLATRSITGSGSIGITGNIVNTGNAEFTGSIKAQSLGGNLSLGTYNITGTGNIEIGGNITNYGNHILAGNLTGTGDITRTGNINVTGSVISATVSTGAIVATTGLGGNLSLNTFGITGPGSITIGGNISATGTMTSGNILGTGNITRTGNVDVTGTIKSGTGLGGNLSLNTYTINGSGAINVTGYINDSVFSSRAGATIGQVGLEVGSTTKLAQLTVIGDTAGYPLQIKAVSDSSGGSAIINIAHIGGTQVVPTAVVNDRPMGGMEWTAFNGATFVPSCSMITLITDTGITTSSTQVKSKIFIGNTTEISGGTSGKYLSVDSSGVVAAAVFQCKTYATGSLPSSPVEGMIAYDITTHQFKGWNGTAWAVLG